MGIIWTIIIGFVIGLVARFFKSGDDNMGFILTTVLGIIGAFVGTYLGQVLGIYNYGESAGFIGAVIGAMIVLALLRAVSGRKS